MTKQLLNELVGRLLLMFPLLWALVFLPAGTWRYWEGWVFGAVFLACNLVMTLYLVVRDPKLLERRMRVGPAAEKSAAQKIIMVLATLAFAAATVLPAIDHRFGWSDVPAGVVLLGDALVVLSYVGFLRVFKENSFGAATIQVEAEQPVISSGPYAVVRHPMYSWALVLMIGMPLALGSWWGLGTLVPGVLVLAWRLLDEERFLHANLRGYTEYTRKVRWRLVPGVF
mgnify:CR=1 FL=1